MLSLSKHGAAAIVLITFPGVMLSTSKNAPAQTPLPRLHVPSFTMRADTAHPQLEQPFHLIINAHFKEQLPEVTFIVLPNLAELPSLGDERHTIAAPSGTDYTEILTVVAHHTGKIHVEPAYFNAIDGRDGKAKRFLSNPLDIAVVGGALEDPFAGMRGLVVLGAKIVLALLALFVLGTIFLRRKPAPVAREPAGKAIVLPPPVPVRSERDELRDLLRELRAAPVRATVMRVRTVLWAMAGAAQGETLGDVLRRLGNRKEALHPVLRLTERAAFIQDAYLQGAIDDMILALERYVA